jgi:hypothetical protein
MSFGFKKLCLEIDQKIQVRGARKIDALRRVGTGAYPYTKTTVPAEATVIDVGATLCGCPRWAFFNNNLVLT